MLAQAPSAVWTPTTLLWAAASLAHAICLTRKWEQAIPKHEPEG